MNKTSSRAGTFLAALAMLCIVAPALADVKPAALFGDHMVLQGGVKVPVWGTATPGEQVTVTLSDQKQSATAGEDGKWMVRLDELKPGGPFEMTIAGKNAIAIKDVLVGEVWLGSGQSNMDFVMSRDLAKYPGKAQRFAGVIDEEKEIAAANFPQVRMFTVKTKMAAEPQADVEGEWQVCTPENVPGFSAVGYYFARDLHKATGRPVGFIKSAFGASCAQAWASRATLESDPQLKVLLDRFAEAIQKYDQEMAARAGAPASAPTNGATTQRGGGRANRGPRNPLQDQHNPYVLWNGMMVPLQPYAIKGVLWYQGESITEGLDLYPAVVEAVIKSWRREWGQGDFPFYFVQLAALDSNSNRPEVREAQAKVLRVPNTAMVVTLDIGDKKDVHPHNKQDVGARLARIARARDYGEQIEHLGPMFESMTPQGEAIRVTFSHAGGGLTAKDGPLKWFQVAGADGKFVNAEAKIDGSDVVVSSPEVKEPRHVRYAWHRWPEGANLYNAAGLPAAPFRTDAPEAPAAAQSAP